MTSESFREFRRRAIFLAALTLIILFVLRFPGLIIIFFGSIMVGSVFTGMAGWLATRLGVPHWAGLLLTVSGSAAVLAGLGALIGIPFASQIDRLSESLTSSYQSLIRQADSIRFLRHIVDELPNQGEWIRRGLSGPVLGIFSGVIGAAANVLLIFFIALYLAVNPGLYVQGMLALFPKSSRSTHEKALRMVGRSLRYWMLGRLASMTVVGVLTGMGLWFTGVPLVLALAVISGLLAFVPVVGPIAAAVPGVLLGLSQSPGTGALVIVVYLVVQTLESYLITPIIDKHVVSLPPVLLLASQAVFAALAGIGGVIFAAPLTLAAVILIQQLYVRRELGYDVETIGKQ